MFLLICCNNSFSLECSFICSFHPKEKSLKNKFSNIKNAFRFSLGAINNWCTFQWQHKHVKLMTQKLHLILTCSCIWWYKQSALSWRLKRIFPVLTCENFSVCQRNLISFLNASTAIVKWFHLRCHHLWFFNSQSTIDAGSFFKKHVRGVCACVCVCVSVRIV